MSNPRWLWQDEAGNSWRMSKNPSSMTNPLRKDTVQTLAGVIETRPRAILKRGVRSWQFSGTVRSQAECDQLTAWCAKTGVVTITDHLGRVFRVTIQRFNPTQGDSPIASVSFAAKYTVTAYILD